MNYSKEITNFELGSVQLKKTLFKAYIKLKSKVWYTKFNACHANCLTTGKWGENLVLGSKNTKQKSTN